jgi:DNA-binding MurR/RpiR family transcriptional regulator
MGAIERDWKQDFANDAEKAINHDLVRFVVEEFIDNMSPSVDLSKGLPRYGLTKIMHYAAMVARAQAIGIDPETLRLDAKEATAEMIALAEHAHRLGKPVIVITPTSKKRKPNA